MWESKQKLIKRNIRSASCVSASESQEKESSREMCLAETILKLALKLEQDLMMVKKEEQWERYDFVWKILRISD